ncbi:MAG TPA: CorA family divalent cation transporter [Spongiibacteraceae bacterium]|nr:CorA family divalent cation transporter [Spongiibacteraceae bacterium]
MNVDTPDSGGLICGFRLQLQGTAQPLKWDAKFNPDTIEEPVWLHFNLADTRATNWIATCEAIPPDARDLLLDHEEQARHEVADNGIALVIGDLHHDFSGDPEGLGTLRLYIDKHLLITGRRHPLKAVDELRREMSSGLEVATTGDLFARLIELLAAAFQRVVKDQADIVDDVEDQILAGNVRDQGAELGRVRRLLTRLRRHVNGERHALAQGLARVHRWAGSADTTELRQAVERLDGTAQDLELVQERSRLMQEEIAGRLGEATNRNLYLLSVLTTVLLPINLITGIFGMNTPGLPWTDNQNGFWHAVICMLIGIAISLAFLRRNRIL